MLSTREVPPRSAVVCVYNASLGRLPQHRGGGIPALPHLSLSVGLFIMAPPSPECNGISISVDNRPAPTRVGQAYIFSHMGPHR